MPNNLFIKSEDLFTLIEHGLQEDYYIHMLDMTENYARFSEEFVRDFSLSNSYVEEYFETIAAKIHPEDLPIMIQAWERVLNEETDIHHSEFRILNAEGKYVWLQCQGKIARENGTPIFFCGGLINLGADGKFDGTTNLLNYKTFQKDLIELEANKQEATFLIIDIHNFSKYNERYSYTFGDQLLSTFAKKLTELLPDNAKLYRLDNDKFVYVGPKVEKERVHKLFKNIQLIAEEGFYVSDSHVSFHISGGTLLYPDDGADTSILYRNLQYALLKSKKGGLSQLVSFDFNMLDESLHSIKLMHTLEKSVSNNFEGFSLAYQPIVSGNTTDPTGCEVLLRFETPEFGKVPPSEVIPILETEGLIVHVGQWIIDQSLKQLTEWQTLNPEMRMNINISYIQFMDNDFFYAVKKLMNQYNPVPGSVVFELTESCNVVNIKSLDHEIMKFKNLGIKIALDDFGTGYSSLNILRGIKTDFVKIDHKFVANIVDSHVDQCLLKHIILLCKKLGISVCVEGIETKEILSEVCHYSPECLQGYLFSRPCDNLQFEKEFLIS